MRPLTANTVETHLRAAIDAGDTTAIDHHGALLDRLATPRPPVPLVAAALYYAEQGLHVFPLAPGSKIPHRGSKGCHDATADPDRVRAWWVAEPASNIGIATGHLVDVIDIDGPAGALSWARMEGLPHVLGAVSTPRAGGTHLYVAATGRGNRAGIAPSVDYRGVGGYVVAPPSVNANGVAYHWRSPLQLDASVAQAAA